MSYSPSTAVTDAYEDNVRKMRQASLIAPKTLIWRDQPVPAPRAGEVLVKIRAALTCGTDLKTYRRGHPKLKYGPFGHEASGDVVAVGSGVEPWMVGDAVMWVQTAPCDVCALCRNGRHNLCERLFDDVALGAYGDYLLLPRAVVKHNLYAKPPQLSYIEAAFLEPVASVVHGWNVLRDTRKDRAPAPNVAILGAGTIGLLHLLYARKLGVAATVIGRGQGRLELAKTLGAHEVLPAETSCNGRRFAAVIECAGTPEAWRQAVALTEPGGQVLLFSGLARGVEAVFDATRMHYEELTCVGSFHFTPSDVAAARNALVAGLHVRPLISGIEPLSTLQQIFERLDRRDGHKYALVPEPAPAGWL